MNKYIFFYSHIKSEKDTINKHIFSQFYPCNFKDNHGIKYNCAEQYMMAKKAEYFKDYTIYKKIMLENSPNIIKKYGRQVKNFNTYDWGKVKYNIVKKGNMYKFSQNENLKKILLLTGNKILAEASKYDHIWGIGLYEKDVDIKDKSKWGKNLLGKALMKVRNTLKNEH